MRATHAPFPPTRWTLIAEANGPDKVVARAALEKLCAAYWYPLYACVRRRGLGPKDVEERRQAAGEGAAFALLKPALTEPTATALDTAAVAESLGIPRDQVRVRVHRLRGQFREALMARIAVTLHTSRREELEAELHALLATLRSR